MVPSGRPRPPCRRVSSAPSIVPTVRLTLRTGSSSRTGVPSASAPSHSCSSVLSSACCRPWSCGCVQVSDAPGARSGTCSTGARSRPPAFQCSTARRVSSTSAWPIASSSERKPSRARCSRTSCATYWKNVTRYSALPEKFLRSSGRWVATPTGQVSRWQTRIMMQPLTTSGAVAKPYSSAPEQRGDDDVAAGLELAVDLHGDAVAQAVEQQRLLHLGEPELPRRAGVLEARERRGAGAAVVARRRGRRRRAPWTRPPRPCRCRPRRRA